MPIYEYVCRQCENEFEKITSFSSAIVPACPRCASSTVERKLSPPAIHFKGSGWYITDSKNSAKKSVNGKSEGNGAESNGESSDESKSESKAETETAAKAETATGKEPSAPTASEGKSAAPAKEAAKGK